MIHILPVFTAFILTLLFLWLTYDFAKSIDLVDRPSSRKRHKGFIPLTGGIAILFGFSIACLISPRGLSEWRPLFICLIPLAVIGVMDDHGDISVTKRICIQIFSCIIMIYHGDVKILQFGNIFGFGRPVTFIGLETVVTIFCVVGVLNSLNLIDGIDGICGSICLVNFFSIIVLVIFSEVTTSIAIILYFASAIIGFLIVNTGLTRGIIKKVFLGDAGTTTIGFFICWYLISLSNGDKSVFRPITAVWIIALPIIDTVSVMIRRLYLKQSPFRPGRDHIHHLLIGLGWSSIKVLTVLTSFAVLLAGCGILAEINDIPESFMFYSFLIVFLLYYLIVQKLSKSTSTSPNSF